MMERARNTVAADHDPDLSDMADELLPRHRCRMLTADPAPATIDILEKEDKSVLPLDMRLTETDGHAVLAALKERDLCVPVTVVTSYPFEEELRGFEGAVLNVLQKPLPVRRPVEVTSTATNEK